MNILKSCKVTLMPDSSSYDIFDLLSGSGEKSAEEKKKADQRKQREELLASTCVKDIFPDGSSRNVHRFSCLFL